MNNRIVVTVRAGIFAKDMELPTNMPIGKLRTALLKVLQSIDPTTFSTIRKIRLFHDGYILSDDSVSLAEYGIKDGYYLDVYQEG